MLWQSSAEAAGVVLTIWPVCPASFRLAARFVFTIGLIFSLSLGRALSAGSEKADHTPAFWQRDPAADFENEGRNHCAPTAISDGLVYLALARDLDGLGGRH